MFPWSAWWSRHWANVGAREKILNELGERDQEFWKNLETGDHIFVWSALKAWNWHGIYCGPWKTLVLWHEEIEPYQDCSAFSDDSNIVCLFDHSGKRVRLDTFDNFQSYCHRRIFKYGKTDEVCHNARGGAVSKLKPIRNTVDVVAVAVSFIKMTREELRPYNFENESFAVFCKTGVLGEINQVAFSRFCTICNYHGHTTASVIFGVVYGLFAAQKELTWREKIKLEERKTRVADSRARILSHYKCGRKLQKGNESGRAWWNEINSSSDNVEFPSREEITAEIWHDDEIWQVLLLFIARRYVCCNGAECPYLRDCRHTDEFMHLKTPSLYKPMTTATCARRFEESTQNKIKELLHVSSREDQVSFKQQRHITGKGDLIFFLIMEVIDNGFEVDLMLDTQLTDLDEVKHKSTILRNTLYREVLDLFNQRDLRMLFADLSEFIENKLGGLDWMSTWEIVNEKLQHPRHLSMQQPLNFGEMLSLVLYCAGACSYDMSTVQRGLKHDVRNLFNPESLTHKWSVFEWCLYQGVSKLSEYDDGFRRNCSVYSGIPRVSFKNEAIAYQFTSFISTSREFEVAQNFRGDTGGIIFRIKPESQRKMTCCDVSWISEYPEEKEVLFAPNNGDLLKYWSVRDLVCEPVRESDGDVNQYFVVQSC